jgi:small-conductance mechanosensitive channel
MGFEIGPLVAGLSVVGVAIGFGCQNFVRDIVADALRGSARG